MCEPIYRRCCSRERAYVREFGNSFVHVSARVRVLTAATVRRGKHLNQHIKMHYVRAQVHGGSGSGGHCCVGSARAGKREPH